MFFAVVLVLLVVSFLWALLALRSFKDKKTEAKVKQELSRHRVIFHKDTTRS